MLKLASVLPLAPVELSLLARLCAAIAFDLLLVVVSFRFEVVLCCTVLLLLLVLLAIFEREHNDEDNEVDCCCLLLVVVVELVAPAFDRKSPLADCEAV